MNSPREDTDFPTSVQVLYIEVGLGTAMPSGLRLVGCHELVRLFRALLLLSNGSLALSVLRADCARSEFGVRIWR